MGNDCTNFLVSYATTVLPDILPLVSDPGPFLSLHCAHSQLCMCAEGCHACPCQQASTSKTSAVILPYTVHALPSLGY